MLLYFQEALKGFYKHTFIKHICNVKAGYVMCQESIYIINLFCLKKKKAKKREIQLVAIKLWNSKQFFFLVSYSPWCNFIFPIFKDYTNRVYKLFSC